MPDQKTIPLRPKGTGSADWWMSQREWCAETKKDHLEAWRGHVSAYCGQLKPPKAGGLRVNLEFEKTEQKRHQLIWRLPAIKLRPHPRTVREAFAAVANSQPGPTQPPVRDLKKAVAIFREALSQKIGPRGANLMPLMEEIVFDVLCPAGIGFVKVGYEHYADGSVMVKTGNQIPDPTFVQPPGNILGLVEPPLIDETAPAPNVVAERYYASRISPVNGLWPQDFTGSDFTKAIWLGHQFWMTAEQLAHQKWTAPSRAGSDDDDDHRIVKLDRKGHRQDQYLCDEIFYYGYQLDPEGCKHPDKIRRLVFVGGVKDPVVHEDYKDQRFDEKTGKFLGGLRTHPIKVLTLRYVSDTAVPPSDCAITRTDADQLSAYVTQFIEHRNKAIPIRGINIDEITDDRMKDKLRDAILKGEYLPDIFTSGISIDKLLSVFAPPAYPQDNYAGYNTIAANANKKWALGNNQSSVKNEGGTTATEIAAIEKATTDRMAAEREIVVGRFLISIVEAFGDLLQLYADREDYVEIVGENGAKSIEAWDKETIKGEMLYEVIPNSALQPDAAADRDLALQRYNLAANSPFANGEELLRDTLEGMEGDPDRLVKQPNPPAPEKPKITLAISGDDLNPLMPQYPNVVQLLAAAGVELTPAPTVAQDGGGGLPPEEPIKPAEVIDRERLRTAEHAKDSRAGGLVGAVS